jgi:hypothetical protein
MPNQLLPGKVIAELPPIIAELINAINAHDTDRIMNTFADDAYVNDNRREIWGVDGIRKLMDNEFVEFKVTMDVRQIIDHYGDIIVSAKYDGTYDRTDLPDEVVMSNYFSIRDGKIVGLTIILNQPSPY